MVTLISTWKLKNGCPPELVSALQELAAKVEKNEPGTLMYLVNVEARNPVDSSFKPLHPPATPIPADEQTEVVFMEAYRDAQAFVDHVSGPLFTAFREGYLKYFYENPSSRGWPNSDTTYFQREATVFRGA